MQNRAVYALVDELTWLVGISGALLKDLFPGAGNKTIIIKMEISCLENI